MTTPAAPGFDRDEADVATRYAAIIKAFGEIVYEWRPKQDVLRWDGEFTRILGYSSAEMGGDTESWTSRVHPDDLPRVLNEVEQARQARRNYDLQYRFRHRDGRYRWMHDRGIVFLDADGQLERIIGVFCDITAREDIARELERSIERFRIVERATNDVVWDWDLVTNELWWNENFQTLFGYTRDQIESTIDSWTTRLHPDNLEHVKTGIQQAIAAGCDTWSDEYRFRRADGSYADILDRGFIIRDHAGRGVRMIGAMQDVSERRRQEVRLQRLSRVRAVTGSINALIVRTRGRAELFQEACRIAVEQGGFPLAWVALVRDETMLPIARHGADGGQLEHAQFPLRADGPGACPASTRAVSERRAVLCADIATGGAEAGDWQRGLLALGYRSFVAYPLMVSGQVVGLFHLYAREPRFFDEEEMALLNELAGDIGYALEFIIKDEKLDFLSVYDPLTRLPNRTLFLRRLGGFIQAAQGSGRRFALLMLDIERFKAINDAIGQDGGDQLLKLVGERLTFHAGGSSYVARIAGDRFAAVLAELARDADVEALVRAGGWDRLEPPFEHAGQEFGVTFKVGIATFPQDGADAEALLRHAELALKHAKAAGLRHAHYATEMGSLAARKLQLGRQLRRALERDEFVLHYQPKVDLRTGQVCGAEALLRWQSPEQGLVMPAAIVPLMEESGLILEVGRWVLMRAAAQRAQWLAEGFAVPRIGVNVSAAQLREKDFAGSVRVLLERSPGAAAGLELEVTESMMMADPDASIATLRTLRELGMTVSMDDFGTGYSSLGYLARLPLNAVKIDRSFIETMAHNADTMNIVSSIVALAHSMGLRVVAEGVETDEQLQFLRVLRCDEMQGFRFAPGLPAAEFAALLRSGRTLGG